MFNVLCLFLLTLAFLAAPVSAADKKKVVFIAGPPSHGFGAHEHYAGCVLLAKCLNDNMPNINAVVYKNGWPKDADAFAGVDAIVIYCDGGGSHVAIPHIKELDDMLAKGVGLGCIHYAVEVPKGEAGDTFTKWIGGYFETFWSINPHWKADFTKLPNHAITRGVRPFTTNDEWYYHMHFRDRMEGVTPILTAIPPDSTRKGGNDPHGGNPTVRAGIGKNWPEHVVWAAERSDGGRGFGCTGGHFHWNWAQDDFRKTILNSIVWIAKAEVPENGVPSKTPTLDELIANQDEDVPANFDRAKMEMQIEEMNRAKTAAK
jgi:type 1 glutamine amidotransferase